MADCRQAGTKGATEPAKAGNDSMAPMAEMHVAMH
jgi:hypothetical protein